MTNIITALILGASIITAAHAENYRDEELPWRLVICPDDRQRDCFSMSRHPNKGVCEIVRDLNKFRCDWRSGRPRNCDWSPPDGSTYCTDKPGYR